MKNTFIRIATALPVALIATLAAVSTAQAAGTTIIDNTNQTSSEFALTGNWGYWSGQGYQSDVHNTGGSTGGNKKATYTFSVTPGEYRVSATWSVYYNRPTDAPYTIYDGATNLGTYRVNQKVQPDDFSDAGGTWEDLATVTVTGDTLTVVLTDDVTTGDTIADAVRIEATGSSHRAFLFVDRQVQEDGTLTAEEVVKALIAFGKAFGASTGAPNFNAAADFDNSGAVNFGDFSFLVPVIENAGHNEIVKAFVYIDANSNFVLTQSEVNSAFERFSAVFGTNDSEADFNEDGLVDFGDFSYLAFVINAAGLRDPNQTVFIIDNTKQSSSEFALTGNWGYWTGQGYEGDVGNSQGTTGGNKKATYTFAVAPGTYRVSTTWSVYYNRPENAPYTLYDGATNLGTYRVNQKVQPDDFSDAGGTWEDLATVTVTGDTLTVVLTDDVSAGKDVIADAVRVEKVTPKTPEVVAHHIFYNNSSFDGNDANLNSADDSAIAPDKSVLAVGEKATFANYTSYAYGINGIMIDVKNLAAPQQITADDFAFAVGNTNDTSAWNTAPAPNALAVRTIADDTHRISLSWADAAITGKWLEVRLLANENTGIEQEDVFYVGNAVGESGDRPADAIVDRIDMQGVIDNPRNFLNPAPIDFPYDYNRDKRVAGRDFFIARDSQTTPETALCLIEPGAGTACTVRQLGDVNNDGYITYTDIQLVTEHLDGTSLLSDADRPYADANQNGKIEATDAWLIGLKSALLIELPAFYGDMDGDLQVQADDTVTVQRIIEGTVTPTAAQEALADVNRDDVIDAKDVELIQAYIGQTIPELPYFCGNLTEEASPPAAECNETTAQLFVTEKSIGITDTAVVNQKNVSLLSFEAYATEVADILLTKAEFAANAGSLTNAQNYTLWVDTDDDNLVDTILESGVGADSEKVSFRDLAAGGYIIPSEATVRFEVRADIASSLTTNELQLRFADPATAYLEAEELDEGTSLTGIETDEICVSTCQIHVRTLENGGILWEFARAGNLLIGKDQQPIPHRQLLGGELSESVLRMEAQGQYEAIDVTLIQFNSAGIANSVDLLELFREGEASPFAVATRENCPSEPFGHTFCAVMQSQQLVINEDENTDIIVRARMKTDNTGATSGEEFHVYVGGVEAIGVESSNTLLSFDNGNGNNKEGEIIRTTDNIEGPTMTSVLSKVTSITNANPDANGTAVPTGISSIGQFKFTAAQNGNSKDGPNSVVLSDIIFSLVGQNVLVDPTSFTMYNKANSVEKHSCELLNADGSSTGAASTVVSGGMYVHCSHVNDVVDTTIEQGTDSTFVLETDVLNPNTSFGQTSFLQVQLDSFADFALNRTFGVNESHIQWIDTDQTVLNAFQWMEYPETEVKSTAYSS